MSKVLILASVCLLSLSFQSAQALEITPLLAPLQALTQNSQSTYTLAVIPLERSDQKTEQGAGQYLTDAILKELISLPAFVLVERQNIAAVLKEQGFGQSAYVTPEQAVEVGKLSGARLILSGHYLPVANDLQVQLRLIDAESGRVLTVIQEKIPKDDSIYHLLGEVSPGKKFEADMQNFAQKLLMGVAETAAQNLTQNLTQGRLPAPAKPSFSKQQLFFNDFSQYAPGTVLPQYGPGLVVRRSQRFPMNVLTTENPQAHQLSQQIHLPDNFMLEIHAFDQLKTPDQTSASLLQLELWSANRRQAIKVQKYGNAFAFAGQTPNPGPWRYQQWNILALTKQGNLMSWYVNGQMIQQQSVSESQWQGFMLSSAQLNHWAFTRLAVYAL